MNNKMVLFSTSITSSYSGQALMEFLSKSLLSGTTIDNNLVTLRTNIKYKEPLRVIDLSNTIQPDSCTFNPQGNITLVERMLEPKKFKVNFKECKTAFESEWEADKMRAGSLNSSYTPDLESWLTGFIQGQVSQQIEKAIWQGSTASGVTGSTMEGFVEKMLADSAVVDVTGATLSATNILTEMDKVVNAIPDQIYGDPEIGIYVSRKTMRFFKQAILETYGLANNRFDITADGPDHYRGIPVYITGIADDTMVCAKKSNLFLGTDLVADYTEARWIDFSETDGSDNLGFKMRFSLDVNHAIGSEVVLYKK